MMTTPTTQEVSDNIVAQIEGALSTSVPLLPKAVIRVLAKVLAGVFVILWKYGGWVFLQIFVATASMAETVVNGKAVRPLVQWGRLIRVGDPHDATRAELICFVIVTNQTDFQSQGTKLVLPSTRVIYEVAADVALNGPSIQFVARAVADPNDNGGAGTIGNVPNGTKLSFSNAPSSVATDAVVAATQVAGADAEGVDAYRARVIQRFQRRPQGGAYADYQAWAEDVPGITAAYIYTGAPGVVEVYCEATQESSGSADGFPSPAQVSAVSAAIELDESGLASRRPVNAKVHVQSITRQPIQVVVVGLAAPDLDEAKDRIQEGVVEYLLDREPFIVGLSTLGRKDRITAGALGGIADQIASSVGGSVTRVTLTIDAEAERDTYTLGPGEKAKLDGDVVWT